MVQTLGGRLLNPKLLQYRNPQARINAICAVQGLGQEQKQRLGQNPRKTLKQGLVVEAQGMGSGDRNVARSI